MSLKLRDFINVLSQDITSREATEMGSFVSWLRRKVAILKHVDTATVIEVIRHSGYINASKDDILFQQTHPRTCNEQLRFFIVLRGSISVYFNPFLSHGKLRRGSASSFGKVLQAASLVDGFKPKSASSKRTNVTRMSQTHGPLPEQPEGDVSDAESDDSMNNDVKMEVDTTEKTVMSTPTSQILSREHAGSNPQSRNSRESRRENVRSRLGRFMVKYDNGKYFEEEPLLDESDHYNTSVIADQNTDIMFIHGDTFNQFVKEHCEKEATDITNFVDIHPFFKSLPLHSRGFIQLNLRIEHYTTGSFIVKQGEPINKLVFLVSGSAEVFIEPAKHRYQYPDLWPFETSGDIYYNEFEWLRESRRRVYSRRYVQTGEISRRNAREVGEGKRQEISVCAVQRREVIGITEIVLDLPTHMNSLRCLDDCEVYSLNLKPFKRVVKRFPSTLDLIRAYAHMKLQYRIDNSLGDQVPLLKSLLVKTEKEIKGKSYTVTVSKNVERQQEREKGMLQLLKWFKMDKAPLARNIDPEVIKLKETMKCKAYRREKARKRTEEFGVKERQYIRRGCIASLRLDRQPLSLHRLRDPMNEVLLKLRMEGTVIASEDELDDLLMRYSETPIDDRTDIRTQTERVVDEEYNLLRYRRHGNRLVRQFVKMIDSGDRRYLLRTSNRQPTASAILDLYDEASEDDLDVAQTDVEDFDELATYTSTRPTYTNTRPTTYKSVATTATYKTLQFERRCMTPRTLHMRIRDFHSKYGGKDTELDNLPTMRLDSDIQYDADDHPVPGGKVFVTTLPCVSCNKKVHLKNHTHIRCQMLHELPMNKVKEYRPM